MLGWDRYGLNKKRDGTHYTKLVFLHTVRSVGQVVHSGASGVRNVTALFVTLGWDCTYRFYKKRTGTRYAELEFLHPVGFAGHVVHSSASGS
jgi:hypothetical protein